MEYKNVVELLIFFHLRSAPKVANSLEEEEEKRK